MVWRPFIYLPYRYGPDPKPNTSYPDRRPCDRPSSPKTHKPPDAEPPRLFPDPVFIDHDACANVFATERFRVEEWHVFAVCLAARFRFRVGEVVVCFGRAADVR